MALETGLRCLALEAERPHLLGTPLTLYGALRLGFPISFGYPCFNYFLVAVQRLALGVACDRLLVRRLGRLGFAGWPAACFPQRRLGLVDLAAHVYLGAVSLHRKC